MERCVGQCCVGLTTSQDKNDECGDLELDPATVALYSGHCAAWILVANFLILDAGLPMPFPLPAPFPLCSACCTTVTGAGAGAGCPGSSPCLAPCLASHQRLSRLDEVVLRGGIKQFTSEEFVQVLRWGKPFNFIFPLTRPYSNGQHHFGFVPSHLCVELPPQTGQMSGQHH